MLQGMTALSKPRMSVEDYLDWAIGRPGRYELFRGEVFTMAPETSGHAEAKYAVQSALSSAIKRRNLACHMLPDGMTVRTEADTAYEPDALVYCGTKLPPSAVEVPEPMILVEVLSPSTRRIDVSLKLAGYFGLPSVLHYLVLDTAKRLVIHHARGTGGTILTRVVTEGTIALDPPGLDIALADIYGA